MSEFLLEIFSEEIPASMQQRAAEDLQRLMTGALVEKGLHYAAARAFSGPRRLVLVIDGLPAATPDRKEERRGPRIGAPEAAIEGFLRSAGVSRESLRTETLDKGEFYLATIEAKGRATAEILAEIIPATIASFPWPKSMVWGTGSLRWVRPLKSILCAYDGEVVNFEIDGIASGAETSGHRFMSRGPVTAKRFEAYAARLEAAHVVIDADARRQIIEQEARTLAFSRHLQLVEDPALAEEVSGLVEWPVVLMGAFDSDFLDVPPEVLTTTMRVNQKYFALRDPKTGKLAPNFLVVANLAAEDGGRAIIAGNEKVLHARLSDARFFWAQDRKTSLRARLPQLAQIVFHAKLGTIEARARRMVHLARHLCDFIPGADADAAATAAELAKADLGTGMVGEFPELQGVMGRYYALHDGLSAAVADAIRDHYAPLGPGDAAPSAPVSLAVALAEKIDTLVGFFGIDERPTGSKDPYALRRAALGVIRIILENRLRLKLLPLFEEATRQYRKGFDAEAVAAELLTFLADRLKVHLKGVGISHDLINAVFGLGGQDDLVLLEARLAALKEFLGSDDGANLLAAYRRAANIVRIEEKKDGRSHQGAVRPELLVAAEEQILKRSLDAAKAAIMNRIEAQDFPGAMMDLARLRPAVDGFFEAVTVNADDTALRANRLSLLSEIRAAMGQIADFSQIEGQIKGTKTP